jgi:ABC-2 type transport system permease protein
MTTTTVRATAIVAAGMFVFRVPFDPTSWWLLIGVFLLTLIALYGLGMMFASLFLLWGREAWHMVNLLQEPVYLLTGTNFPLRNVFPMAIAGAALLIPLAAGMDAMRQVLFRADGVIAVKWEVTLLAGLAVTFLTLAKRSLDYLERKSREEGRLTVRWE